MAVALPAATPPIPKEKLQLAIAMRVSGAATLGEGEEVAVGVRLDVRVALGDAPGAKVPRIHTSSMRNVLALQRYALRAQQKSGLPSASLGKVTVGITVMAAVSAEELGPCRLNEAPASVL